VASGPRRHASSLLQLKVPCCPIQGPTWSPCSCCAVPKHAACSLPGNPDVCLPFVHAQFESHKIMWACPFGWLLASDLLHLSMLLLPCSRSRLPGFTIRQRNPQDSNARQSKACAHDHRWGELCRGAVQVVFRVPMCSRPGPMRPYNFQGRRLVPYVMVAAPSTCYVAPQRP
jgi:hypothetical protein